ncbi:TPA: hypothetical protein ACPTCW_004238 [Yersinia enterocolitica]
MSSVKDLVGNAMQSCLEGYVASVVDSIEFELKRELSTEEYKQVDAAVDYAITGIDSALKEIHNLKIKLSDAGCLLVEWKQRVERAEKERDDLLNQEFQQRLANAEHQLYMKDLAIHNIKASRKAQFRKRLAAEAALSAANEKPKPISFDELADRVQFVTGGIRMSFDPLNCKGHQIVPFMNFNSLSRIVEMYRTTETYHLAGFTVGGGDTATIAPAPEGVVMRPPFKKPLEHCAAARDGECSHKDCPQLRDNEPMATGRHCPIDDWDDE